MVGNRYRPVNAKAGDDKFRLCVFRSGCFGGFAKWPSFSAK
jgi:hypothetical protein